MRAARPAFCCLLDEGNSEIYLFVLDSLPTDCIRTNCPAGCYTYAMGAPPCKQQSSIATFIQVIQPCLKISAESFNSSNEARSTSGVSRISARGVLKVRPHTKSRGGGGGGASGPIYEKWGGGGGASGPKVRGGAGASGPIYEKWGGGGGPFRFRSDTFGHTENIYMIEYTRRLIINNTKYNF